MPFLRNQWYVAAQSSEIEARPFARWILGEPLVLFRRRDGSVAALEDRCPHRRAPLSAGEVLGDEIQCGYHGARFKGNGTCTLFPSQPSGPGRGFAARSYRVVERPTPPPPGGGGGARGRAGGAAPRGGRHA